MLPGLPQEMLLQQVQYQSQAGAASQNKRKGGFNNRGQSTGPEANTTFQSLQQTTLLANSLTNYS